MEVQSRPAADINWQERRGGEWVDREKAGPSLVIENVSVDVSGLQVRAVANNGTDDAVYSEPATLTVLVNVPQPTPSTPAPAAPGGDLATTGGDTTGALWCVGIAVLAMITGATLVVRRRRV